MRIHPVAELKCNSQSARRLVAGATRQGIGPFVLERSYCDGAAVRRELDRQALFRARGHFPLRAFQQVESRCARLGLAVETKAGAGQSRIEYRHAMER